MTPSTLMVGGHYHFCKIIVAALPHDNISQVQCLKLVVDELESFHQKLYSCFLLICFL